MLSVVLQVGHKNIEQINTAEQKKHLRSWRDTNYLQTSTGAAGERDYHWDKIMPLLKDMLIAAGIQVHVVDAIWRPETYNRNYDLWVSLHYDGGGTENRCMISSPLRRTDGPYLNKAAHDKADEFCKIWREIYPAQTGAVNRNERITAGMLEYYAFDYVVYDTPAVIIEHFNHTSDKGKELKDKAEVVARADFEAIVKFLKPNIAPQPPVSDPNLPIDNLNQKLKVGNQIMTLADVAEKLGRLQVVELRNAELERELSSALTEPKLIDTLGVLSTRVYDVAKKIEDLPLMGDDRYRVKLAEIFDVINGSGFAWSKIGKIEEILAKP